MKWSWRWSALVGGALAVAAGIAGVLAYVSVDSRGGPDAAADARTAYCLAPAHVVDFLGAAAALGLVQPGVTADRIVAHGKATDLAHWRVQQSADFNRACAAESATVLPRAAGSTWFSTTATTVFQVLLGSLVALASGNLATRKERGRNRADALRTAWQAFAAALSEYTEARGAGKGGVPPADSVNQQRAVLVVAARRAGVTHRSWQDPEKLIHMVENELGGAVTHGWGTTEAEGKVRQQAVTATAATTAVLVETVAAGAERVIRPRRGA